MLLAGAIALTGCSGDDGSVGPAGNPGQPGAPGEPGAPGAPGADLTATAKPESCAVCHPDAGSKHQAIYDQYTDPATLKATILSVVSTANTDGTFNSKMTFTVTLGGVAPAVADLKQTKFYAVKYDAADPTVGFETATAFSYGNMAVDPTTPGQFIATASNVKFAPELEDSFVYAYFAAGTPIVQPEGHYKLYPEVVNVAKKYGAWTYTSAANVEGCEACHGSPYQKHGYRGAVDAAAQVGNFVICKGCHTDQRVGTDQIFQMLADDPLAVTQLTYNEEGEPNYTVEQLTNYAYRATVMNDTHQSHAMEFAYPQSMANCVACHKGKLTQILTDANFTLETCKSCHPVTGLERDSKRAPALKNIVTVASYHPTDFYTATTQCNGCHKAGGYAPTFATIHAGYDKTIYSNETTKYSSTVKSQIDTVTFDSATNKLTVAFSVTGASASAIVKPTVVISLYGYDTKDFIVSGHGSQADGTKNLEWVEGAVQRSDPTKSANSDRLTVAPAAAAAGVTSWTATANLSLWAGRLADGSVKKVEIGVLPAMGLDPAAAPGATNAAVAIGGATKTFDLVGKAVVDNAYGKAIVDVTKCNACHDTLGTTFHSPSYGSAGVVACRLCHVVDSGGSHLEMQSRSIDSYVHAIHAMQPFDVGDVDFADPVEALRTKHHVESTYPNFTILNCESCHNPGTYEVPDQAKSLVGVLSASDDVSSEERTIGAVPSYVVGPASRACGSCHRAEMINENLAGELATFNAHTASFGTLVENGQGVFAAAVEKIMAVFK